jgi:protein translocase SecG subunit
MLENILIWSQLVVAVLLAVSILLQNRGSGLSASFGGDFGGYYTKRGMEKFLYWGSVVLAALFLGLAIANIYFGSVSA